MKTNQKISNQNEPKLETYAEPKAKSEPVPTPRERAGKPNFNIPPLHFVPAKGPWVTNKYAKRTQSQLASDERRLICKTNPISTKPLSQVQRNEKMQNKANSTKNNRKYSISKGLQKCSTGQIPQIINHQSSIIN